MDKLPVRWTHIKATALISLYGRALESRTRYPLLNDPFAALCVERLDYPFRKFRLLRETAIAIAGRTYHMDEVARDFLRRHRRANVLHLGCGVDARVLRVRPPAQVNWFEVDFPDVIGLRNRLLPAAPGSETIGASVTDLGWLVGIPARYPTLILAEGLQPFLDPDLGVDLFRALVARFPKGELIFDAYTPLGADCAASLRAMTFVGAQPAWTLPGPEAIARVVPGLTLLSAVSSYDAREIGRTGSLTALGMQMGLLLPQFRNMSRIYRFGFGDTSKATRTSAPRAVPA